MNCFLKSVIWCIILLLEQASDIGTVVESLFSGIFRNIWEDQVQLNIKELVLIEDNRRMEIYFSFVKNKLSCILSCK